MNAPENPAAVDPEPSPPRRRRPWWRLLAGPALMALGVDLMSPNSRVLTAVGVALILGGAAGLAWAILSTSRPGGVLHRSRREIGLVLSSSALFVVVALVAMAAVRLGPGRWLDDPFDADLGWAPTYNPELVGQRLQRVDATPGRQHVLLVGDSILYGRGVDNTETAAHLMDGRLPPYQVLNLAVNGYSIDQEYLYLKREIGRLHPKLVVLGVYSGNDFQITAREYGWGHTKPLFRLGDQGELLRVNPNLLGDNCIDHLAQSMLFRFLWSDHNRAQDLMNFFCQPLVLERWEAEAVIEKLYEAIEAEARAHGARTLFVMFPDINDFPGIGNDFFSKYYSRYESLRRPIARRGYDLYDLYPALLASGVPVRDLFLDPGHYNPRGQKVVADALVAEIKRRYGL